MADPVKPADGDVVLFSEKDQTWIHYASPVKVFCVYDQASVLEALREIEGLVEDGAYAAGFISYEAAPAFDAALHVLGPDPDTPLLWFGIYVSQAEIDLPCPAQPTIIEDWTPSEESKAYASSLASIKSYIEEGDTYQVNHTMRLHADSKAEPWELFCSLAAGCRASNAAYIQTERFAVCSFSPELFFRRDGRSIVFQPMKGTAARKLLLEDDVRQAEWLQASEKNRAENVMIVDMIRNDIGRVAEAGSVKVPELFTVEKYPTVWQMTSTVCAEVDVGMTDLFKAVFPCASITGAPKCRTMEIIRELETEPRGVYTGAIGWMGPGCKSEFGVAIRTVYIKRDSHKATYGVGGGIVWDSGVADEYEECRMKSLVLSNPRPRFDLLESMLWTESGGYYLHDYHLERLQQAAQYFDYPYDHKEIVRTLSVFEEGLETRSKVRLLLNQQGGVTLESSVIPAAPQKQPLLKVCVADQPIQTDSPFVYYKTTHRGMYDRFKEHHAGYDEVLLWNERGELTEGCTSNIVLQVGSDLFTPPVRCGLLGGTYRRWMLESGRIRQRVISRDALPQISRIFMINSVRGMRECVLATKQS